MRDKALFMTSDNLPNRLLSLINRVTVQPQSNLMQSSKFWREILWSTQILLLKGSSLLCKTTSWLTPQLKNLLIQGAQDRKSLNFKLLICTWNLNRHLGFLRSYTRNAEAVVLSRIRKVSKASKLKDQVNFCFKTPNFRYIPQILKPHWKSKDRKMEVRIWQI